MRKLVISTLTFLPQTIYIDQIAVKVMVKEW